MPQKSQDEGDGRRRPPEESVDDDSPRAKLVLTFPPGSRTGVWKYVGGPNKSKGTVVRETGIGDSGDEYLYMARGDYSAWPYVIMSVFYSLLLLSVPIALAVEFALRIKSNDETRACGTIMVIAITLWNYWNRWRCIEAFSSRFCSGYMGISAIYVPCIAAVYAAYRGVKKLYGQ